jgi:hypothetical protein
MPVMVPDIKYPNLPWLQDFVVAGEGFDPRRFA